MRKSRAKRPVFSEGDIARHEADIAVDSGPYAQWVRPSVDRRALLDAVTYPYADQWLSMYAGHGVSDEQEERWRTLFRIRAIQRELSDWADELGADAPSPDDPRSHRITKAELFEVVNKRPPRNTASASRWFAAKVAPNCGPSPRRGRGKVTVNLNLFAKTFGNDAVQRLIRTNQ